MALDVGRRTLEREVRAARREGRAGPRVVIVGAGLSGLGMAVRLLRCGLSDVAVLEQSDGVGGTWRDNSYPGSGCDVPSHLYSFSFAPKSDWTRRYAEQPEILTYAERLVAEHRLEAHLRLGTTVDRAALDEDTGHWRLWTTSARGEEELEADAVVFACGQLNRPHVPDLPGRDTFAGPSWHSARWDHGCDLDGKRVAVVGSGASAIQFVPRVATQAASVTIFQRTPNFVAPKRDKAYSDRARRLFGSVRTLERAHRWTIYWLLESRWMWFRKGSWSGRKLRQLFTDGLRKDVVSERLPEEAVVPDYPLGCKRVLISNEWYPTIVRPDVSVVDRPIDRVEADAVVAGGVRHPADVLIFGTGFSTTDFLSTIPVTGSGGRTLAAAWAEGARAYRGVAVAGFPNCYLLYGPNTNLGHNSILFMVERQINLILQALAEQVRRGGRARVPLIGVTDDAYRRDDVWTQRRVASTVWAAGCHSWYKSASGRVVNNWPTWTVRYWLATLRLRPDQVTEVGAVRPPAEAPVPAGRAS